MNELEGSLRSACVYSQEGALKGLMLMRGDYKQLLPGWTGLFRTDVFAPGEEGLVFKEGLDNGSSGDVCCVNTNTLDLSLTFDSKRTVFQTGSNDWPQDKHPPFTVICF